MSQEGIVKLTDFGISTFLSNHLAFDLRTALPFRGTLRYADPVLLGDNPKPTTYTDLWAFAWLVFGVRVLSSLCLGVFARDYFTLFQILTGRRPYHHIQSELRVNLAIMQYDVPCSGNHPDISCNKDHPSLPYGDIVWPVLRASWSRSNLLRWPASCIADHIREVSQPPTCQTCSDSTFRT